MSKRNQRVRSSLIEPTPAERPPKQRGTGSVFDESDEEGDRPRSRPSPSAASTLWTTANLALAFSLSPNSHTLRRVHRYFTLLNHTLKHTDIHTTHTNPLCGKLHCGFIIKKTRSAFSLSTDNEGECLKSERVSERGSKAMANTILTD